MAKFEVLVKTIDVIVEHGNADSLEIAKVGGFQSVVRKGDYQVGDKVVVFPEHALLPESILQDLGLWDAKKNQGRLAGSKGDRVKPIRLRDETSEVVIGKADIFTPEARVGDDLATELSIEKYVVPIPQSMDGALVNAWGYTIRNWDVENYTKSQNDDESTFDVGEPIVVTEKLHGSWCCVGYHKDFGWIVTSKGFSHKGQVFDLESSHNRKKNIYVKWFLENFERMEDLRIYAEGKGADSFHLMGELVGPGVQDLRYGLSEKQLFGFDMRVGSEILEFMELETVLARVGIPRVPSIFVGDFTDDLMGTLIRDANEKYILSKRLDESCFEGFVIRSWNGYKRLKVVHEDYLGEKGRNRPTEYQ